MKIWSVFEGVLCLWRYGACQLSNSHQRVGLLISYCYAIFCSFQSLICWCCMHCQTLVLQQKLCTFLCPLDFGWFFQWSLSRDYKWLQLLLTSTLWPCRLKLYSQAMIFMRSCRLRFLAITSVDGAASTLSSTIVYHMLPGCKGQYANLAGWHQKKPQKIGQFLLV